MRFSFVSKAFVAILFATLPSASRGGVIISMDNATALAGQTVLLGVYASSDSGDVISGFNLPLDYNSDGFVDQQQDRHGDLPAGFSLDAIPIRNALFANTGLDQPFPQTLLFNVDSIPTGSGANITLSNVPTKLFDLVIGTDSTLATGTVLPFQIKIPASPFESVFNVAGPNNPIVVLPITGSPALGSITIVAVPEPNGIALVLAAATFCFVRKRIGKLAPGPVVE